MVSAMAHCLKLVFPAFGDGVRIDQIPIWPSKVDERGSLLSSSKKH
jgi:hypothetical protein